MIKDRYDVVAEAEKIVLRAAKPDWCSLKDWNKLPLEARILYCKCEELPDQLLERFYEEVEQHRWKEALLLYMTNNQKPRLPYNSLGLDTMKRTWDNDAIRMYIAEAEVWLEKAKWLLDSED